MNKKKIWIITIFPEYFKPFFQMGVIARAKEIFEIEVINLRDYALNNYGSVDDSPYGGGPGMVMRADVLFHALEKKIFAELKIDAQTWTAKLNMIHKLSMLVQEVAFGTMNELTS